MKLSVTGGKHFSSSLEQLLVLRKITRTDPSVIKIQYTITVLSIDNLSNVCRINEQMDGGIKQKGISVMSLAEGETVGTHQRKIRSKPRLRRD